MACTWTEPRLWRFGIGWVCGYSWVVMGWERKIGLESRIKYIIGDELRDGAAKVPVTRCMLAAPPRAAPGRLEVMVGASRRRRRLEIGIGTLS